jgi:hypothetical protein
VVYARVLYLNRVSNNHTSALNIDIVITINQKTKIALVDSRATENFIDPHTVERLWLPIQKLQQPWIIYNIDRTLNQAGSITHKCQLKLQFKDLIKMVDFYITGLGQDRAVLGFPFL